MVGFAVLAAAMTLAAVAAAFMPDVRDQPTHDSLEDAQNASLAMVPGGPALTEPRSPVDRASAWRWTRSGDLDLAVVVRMETTTDTR